MTKAGRDHLKARARSAREHGPRRRFPDLLAEVARSPLPSPPSTELVLVCNGLAHPVDGGRCARAAGHWKLDGGGWCSWGPNDAVHVWAGYYNAESQAWRAQEDARRALLTPEDREAEDAEMEDDYHASMGRDPYDPYDDKYELIAMELQDEEHSAAEEANDYDDGDWS
ncbi:hypothetical protein OOK29_25960 [Streptomyces phaeochromogenes]|uniref:hypothetical protein n=1 Tax=Streptomyces phaeochromogenes TaxID=1923 RepID=UPI002258946C|nr:hypothetical protein [Streptomyces phaeochromogenes]MCX5601600.1 hypothetical protein [Streptomyces phaeochromogenes]